MMRINFLHNQHDYLTQYLNRLSDDYTGHLITELADLMLKESSDIFIDEGEEEGTDIGEDNSEAGSNLEDRKDIDEENKDVYEEEYPQDASEEGRNHYDYQLSRLTARCLRIFINCQLIKNNCFDYQQELVSDITASIEEVKDVTYRWNIDGQVVADTLHLLFLFCPDGEKLILDHTESDDTIINDTIINDMITSDWKEEVSEDFWYLLLVISDELRLGNSFSEKEPCLKRLLENLLSEEQAVMEQASNTHLWEEQCSDRPFYLSWNDHLQTLPYTLLKKAVEISRYTRDIAAHRQLVIDIISNVGEAVPELICEICSGEADSFADASQEDLGNFLWYYGYCLSAVGKREEAIDQLSFCYQVRKKLYGEDSWYTAVAGRMWACLVLSGGRNEEAFGILVDFVRKSEAGDYAWVNQEDVRYQEGISLYFMLKDHTFIGSQEEYRAYIDLYEEICEMFASDLEKELIQYRFAKTFRAIYGVKTRDYIQAEKALLEALNMPVKEGRSNILTNAQMKSNLLLIYSLQNDLNHAIPLIQELLEIIESDESKTELNQLDRYRIYISINDIYLQNLMDYEPEEIEVLKAEVDEACHELLQEADEEEMSGRAMFILSSVLCLYSSGGISQSECSSYLEVMLKIEEKKEQLNLRPLQQKHLYSGLGLIAAELEHPDTEKYILKSMELLDGDEGCLKLEAKILHMAAAFYGKIGKTEVVMEYLELALDRVTSLWQSCIRYYNDERLLMILVPIQWMIMSCYGIMRKHSDIQVAYEKILQFKELASLAGRERNRILYKGQVDRELISKIQYLQDKIAGQAADDIFRERKREEWNTDKEDRAVSFEFRDVEECQEDVTTLRELEAEFAQSFPKEVVFTEVTWEKVAEAVPDHSAVIEYFYGIDDYGRSRFEWVDNRQFMVWDVYLIKKTKGQCTLNRWTVPDGLSVLEQAIEFVDILQNEAMGIISMKKENLREYLYKSLLEPVLPFLQGVDKLYIAPDQELINLPFEILYEKEGRPLAETLPMIKIECARDFLFSHQGYADSAGSLLIGNPQYEVREKEKQFNGKTFNKKSSDLKRFVNLKAEDLHQLPFSKIEVQRIARHCDSPYYSGKEAHKGLLLSGNHYKNIHIATHGYFDLSDESNTIYSSCLMFAGAKNWMQTGKSHELYGNGIITADEISRLDFSSIELVVLSACFSGMHDVYVSTGFRGLIGAFSAAGVGYVISHLWRADDFSTAILMEEFYYQYIQRQQSPPVALRLAKQYLAQVTIKELKERGWFQPMLQLGLDQDIRKQLEALEGSHERSKPFKSEVYWGGFSCYRCN